MPSPWEGFFPDTLLRLFVPLCGWLARAYLWESHWPFGLGLIPALDAAIAFGHWWANQPMVKINPAEFRNRRNFSGLLEVPMMAAVLLVFIDLKQLYDGA